MQVDTCRASENTTIRSILFVMVYHTLLKTEQFSDRIPILSIKVTKRIGD